MLHNYLIIAYRNLLKNKAFSAINIFGLAIGMAACLLILQYVIYELSYDKFHAKGKDIYRVISRSQEAENYSAMTHAPLGPILKYEFPEIEQTARLLYSGGLISVANGQQISYREDKVAYADPAFLQIFTYPLLTGKIQSALEEPNTVVISQAYASKYFGKEPAFGKTIIFYDQFGTHICKITGILQDIPANSHLEFNALFSLSTINKTDQPWAKLSNWSWTAFYTYIQLKPNADPQLLTNKFPAFIKKYGGAEKDKMSVQKMTGIHLFSQLQGEPGVNGSIVLICFLTIIAFFILIIAWVNYINLSTARAIDRAKEVGIRKVSGSSQWQLVKQFLLEAVLLNICAIILSLTFVQVFQTSFNGLTDKPLSLNLLQINFVWLGLLGIFMIGAILSGAYPAFVLSSFKPAQVLKGKWSGGFGGGLLRKSLVVFQFAASVALIVGTFTVYTQLNYMRNKNLGMNISQLLVVKAPAKHGEQYIQEVKFFKTEMLRNPSVTQATGSLSIPGIGYNWHSNQFRRQTQESNPINKYNAFYTNNDFFETYQIQFVAGRSFSPTQVQYDGNKEIILNEMAVKQLGFARPADAINQILYNGDIKEGTIVGVVQSYHHESLKSNLEAMVVFPTEWANYFTFRLNGGDAPTRTIEQTIEKAKQSYEALFPGNPFDYFFLDEFFNQKYQADQQFGKVFGLFAALAILVACLGLFALASFTITQRTKEIGIRKVLGASVFNILFLLSKDFARLVLLSNIIAWPLAYWAINLWLQNYPYRIGTSLWLFIVSGFIMLLIALLTISLQTIRTARSNPVESLHYE